MIHKIHMGENLSEDYTIIGYRQSVHNYNDVVYPAPINECTDCHTGGIPTENFPMVPTLPQPWCVTVPATAVLSSTGNIPITLKSGFVPPPIPKVRLFATGGPSGSAETGKWVADGTSFDIYDTNTQKLLQSVPVNATVLGCVSNAPGTFRGDAGAQHTNWMDHPSRKTCGSCHDDINWETGEGHSESNLVMADDITCDNCHLPYTGNEFDRSVRGAHLELYKSAQFPGVLVKLMECHQYQSGR